MLAQHQERLLTRDGLEHHVINLGQRVVDDELEPFRKGFLKVFYDSLMLLV
jgi:hypothetical protein